MSTVVELAASIVVYAGLLVGMWALVVAVIAVAWLGGVGGATPWRLVVTVATGLGAPVTYIGSWKASGRLAQYLFAVAAVLLALVSIGSWFASV